MTHSLQKVCDEFTLLGHDGSVELKYNQNLIYHTALSLKFLPFIPFALSVAMCGENLEAPMRPN